MRSLTTAFLLSTAVHLAAVLLLSRLSFHIAVSPTFVEVVFAPPQASEPVAPAKVKVRSSQPAADERVAVEEAPAVVPREEPGVSEPVVDRLQFFSSTLPPVVDSLPVKPQPTMPLKKKNEPLLLDRPGPYDAAQRALDRRNFGERPPSAADAAGALGRFFEERDDRPVRLDFIPSRTELAVLNSVLQNPHADDLTIYASLDSTFKVTAEDLQRILEKLVQKRLLARTQISPRNELTLPFGATVEMSAQNRRNRLYRYRARIEAQDLVRFLNAVLYELEHRKPDRPRTAEEEQKIAELKERILQAAR